MRIGFLFNHDQIHQVAHSLPIALALARLENGAEIVIAVTNVRLSDEIERLAGPEVRSLGISIRYLGLRSTWRRIVAVLASPVAPAGKILVYGDNLDFFRSLDILVVTEKTSLILKTRYKLNRLVMVHTRHGAGDRAIGFNKASARFDLVLVAGDKIRERLIADAGTDPARIRVVGYPKFDLVVPSRSPFATLDKRPIVLYNPHVSPHLSSWYRQGRAVLDWFVSHPEYRLIFAPHVMLFQRRFVVTIDQLHFDRPGSISDAVLAAPNIFVDLGSGASTDMTYTKAADIYLGDVSSQIYEFLVLPRPCVFLDAHNTEWRDDPNFAHWAAGPVIRDISYLGDALDVACSQHATRFRPIQRCLSARTFDLTEIPSSLRAARAIAEHSRTEECGALSRKQGDPRKTGRAQSVGVRS